MVLLALVLFIVYFNLLNRPPDNLINPDALPFALHFVGAAVALIIGVAVWKHLVVRSRGRV